MWTLVSYCYRLASSLIAIVAQKQSMIDLLFHGWNGRVTERFVISHRLVSARGVVVKQPSRDRELYG